MKGLTIKLRLIATLAFLSVVIIAIGLIGLNGMNHGIVGVETIYKDRLIPTGQLAEINDLMRTNIQQLQFGSQHDLRLEESALHEATHTVEMHAGNVDKGIVKIGELWKSYMSSYLTPKEKALAEKFAGLRASYVDQLKKGQQLLREKKFKEGNMLAVQALSPAFNKAKAAAEELLQLQVDVAKFEYEEYVNVDYTFARNMAIGAIVIGLLLALGAGYMLIRGITIPLGIAIDTANTIADGDLTREVEVKTTDETGLLLTALKNMHEKLSGIVSEVRESSDSINSGANEISTGNLDLSQRTEEQASSLEETAASMEEMTATVKQNADSARQASQLAASASSQAENGGEVVQRAVGAMSEITASSKKIADIIGVIDEIAFQTNLLALNAAVEAARAGEQGRGFAVVAGEVRNLAQRSSEAAKEIKTLIQDSVGKVEEGSKLVDESGKTLEEIVSGVKKLTDIVSEIAAASSEQAAGIEEVNNAITQMDSMTQQNAALVEEAAAASRMMEEQAQSMNKQVAFFKVSGGVQMTHQAAKP